MNRRLQAMYDRAFATWFNKYRCQGLSEDDAIDLAERTAQEELDRYCDDKLEERKTDE